MSREAFVDCELLSSQDNQENATSFSQLIEHKHVFDTLQEGRDKYPSGLKIVCNKLNSILSDQHAMSEGKCHHVLHDPHACQAQKANACFTSHMQLPAHLNRKAM